MKNKIKKIVLLSFFMSFFAITGCKDKETVKAVTGSMGEWITSGFLSIKVEAELGGFYNPNDRTGMTHGLPRFNVDFSIRNDSMKGVSIKVIECEFIDGDGRNLGQAIMRQRDSVIRPSATAEFSTDTNGYHLNPEKCTVLIKPTCEGFSGAFAVDISIPLDPERRAKEMARRKELDDFDDKLRAERAAAKVRSSRSGALNTQIPKLSKPEVLKLDEDTPLITKTVTVHQKPPFYKGPVPLKYTAYQLVLFQNNSLTLVHDFGGWKNLFVYEDTAMKYSGVAEGAITFDNNENLVAVAKLSRLLKGEGVEIEEFHLNPKGDVIFYCKSRFSFGFSWKDSETESKGRKAEEYYVFWPTSSY